MENIKVTIGEKDVLAKEGECLSDVLLKAGIAPPMPCAGAGKCGKCRIKLHGNASKVLQDEQNLLTPEEMENGIRLLCQTYVANETLNIELLNKETGFQNIQTGSQSLEVQNPLFQRFGIAIDIGTTTLAAKLFNAAGILAVVSKKNSQGRYGADVMSRIEQAMNGQAEALQIAVAEDLNSMVKELCKKAACTTSEIDTVVITGNTTMLYLLTGTNPKELSSVPFDASRLFGEWVKGKDLQISSLSNARIYLCNCMSAFVGADITTAALATDLLKDDKRNLLVDIGTNGEMAVWDNGVLTCCATAAGPAFEGAQLHSGMFGQQGAIEHVLVKESGIDIHVIGGGVAKGICGSGVLDAIYALLALGAIDETGCMEEDVLQKLGLFCEEDGQPACKLAEGVLLTQRDIRQVQLAKSAICAGIETLLQKTNTKVDTLYLAGGFGSYLNLDSAAGIGLIPASLQSKTVVVGNAALDGACQVLCNAHMMHTLGSISQKASDINLAESPWFMDRYVDNMCFEVPANLNGHSKT